MSQELVRERARDLRRDQTDTERKLWSRLRDRQVLGAKFRRQHPIGQYIVDFCCPANRLIIELDGSQHAERAAADETRTAFLLSRGYRVLRFWNHEVLKETDAVLEQIASALSNPHPALSLEGRGRSSFPVLKGLARALREEE